MAPRGSGAGERRRICAGVAVHVVFVSGVSYINVFSFLWVPKSCASNKFENMAMLTKSVIKKSI